MKKEIYRLLEQQEEPRRNRVDQSDEIFFRGIVAIKRKGGGVAIMDTCSDDRNYLPVDNCLLLAAILDAVNGKLPEQYKPQNNS